MGVTLEVLNKEDLEYIRIEKNKIKGSWRTPFLLTREMQEDYYNNVVSNRNSNNRIFGICADGELVGTTGISHIEWENRLGEITMFVIQTGKGYGKEAVKLILDYAFDELNLENVYGECYECNNSIDFWKKMEPSYMTILPARKYHGGYYWNSLYFSFNKEIYDENND